MKMLALMLFIALNAQASNLTLHCDNKETPESCGLRAASAVEKLGCVVDPVQTKCQYSLIEDPDQPGSTLKDDTPYCELASTNCSRPLPGSFGGENCFERQKVKIPRSEHVHNGYWFGFWGEYSRTVCIER